MEPPVKTPIQRCAQVIAHMAAAPGPVRLSSIAAALAVPKGATHRLLRELCALGWVAQPEPDGPYALTVRFAVLGHRVLQATGLPNLVQPLLELLAAETRELARLTLATETGLIWIGSAQGAPPGLLYQPALTNPVRLHATANGKAFLATLDDETALRLAALNGFGKPGPTPRTLTKPEALLAELRRVRRRGHAVSAEEAEAGITAVAVVVRRNPTEPALGTVSVAGPTLRIGQDRIPAIVATLSATAAQLAACWPEAAMLPQRDAAETPVSPAPARRAARDRP